MLLKYCRAYILLFLCFFLITTLTAQNEKVGVVLSGGGAKGIAHVGVLKALEEHNVPIDYITGTSIGALVGGMYAGGYSVDSIISIVTSNEFQNWATGQIDDKYDLFYKKQQPNASWISLRFNIDSVWKLKLPTNLISPYQMDFAGMKHFAGVNVASNFNFDSLFVPFRCVAADIEKKETVVLKNGYIYDAIRASMTYPFVYKPIEIDGRILFDGGIYNNFPVNIMIDEFQPDYIIGSAVGMVVRELQQDDIRSHLENLLVFPTDYVVPDSLGLTIRPEVPDISLTDFRKADELILLGYEATISKIEQIKANIDRSVTKEELRKKREDFNNKVPVLLFDNVTVNGVNPRQEEYIKNVIFFHDEIIDAATLKPQYFKLLAEEHIEEIRPKAVFNEETEFFTLDLDIIVDKSVILQFGGNISSSPVNQAYVDVRYLHFGHRASTVGLNAYFGRFYSSLQLNGRMDFSYPTPFFLKTNFTISYYDYFRSTLNFFEDRTPSYLLQNFNFYEFIGGAPAENNGKVTFGFVTGRNRDDYFQTNVFSRADTADRTTLHYISPFVKYERNTLNHKQYPTRGSRFSITTRYVAGDERHTPGSTSIFEDKIKERHEWFQAKFTYENYFASYGRANFGLFTEILYSNQYFFSNYTSTVLSAPAFMRVPSTRTHFLPNYRAHKYAVAGMKTIFNISEYVDVRVGGYMFQPYQEILKDDDFTAYYDDPLQAIYFLGTTSVVVNTAIGPLSLSLSYFDGHDEEFAFSLDFGYLIFHGLPLR